MIIANSGRMLAQFARNVGYKSLVIDCYGDVDTRALALAVVKVNSLSLRCIQDALDRLKHSYIIHCVVYGSGLEYFPETLSYLNQKITLLGNFPDVFFASQNKTQFFLSLKELAIPFPETVFEAPDDAGDWLLKPLQGEGGVGVQRYKQSSINLSDVYWQKYISGITMSVLFLANASGYKIIGFNKQFVHSIAENEFVFSAVMSQPKVANEIVETINAWLRLLVNKLALKGVNSLDFIVNGKQCYLLEVNPRPSASMQLYQNDLLLRHINSLNNQCLPSIDQNVSYQAYQIIYAENDIVIKSNVIWADWVLDRPKTGTIINTAMPICSIIARGKNEQQVKEQLLLRQQIIKKLL